MIPKASFFLKVFQKEICLRKTEHSFCPITKLLFQGGKQQLFAFLFCIYIDELMKFVDSFSLLIKCRFGLSEVKRRGFVFVFLVNRLTYMDREHSSAI